MESVGSTTERRVRNPKIRNAEQTTSMAIIVSSVVAEPMPRRSGKYFTKKS